MNEVEENVFRYPNDISKRRVKSSIKITLILAVISLSIVFLFIFFDPQSSRIANKGEMIFVVSFTMVVLYMLIGVFGYVIEIIGSMILGSPLKNTEIIMDKNNLVRRIKYKEEIFSWETISKVRIDNSIFGRSIEIRSPKRKSVVIFSDIERFDQLISTIKKRISSAIIKEKKYSLMDYVLWTLLLLVWIFCGLYLLASPTLEPILYIVVGVLVLYIFFRSPIFSSIYGSKGKWIDWIVIIYCIYYIASSVIILFQ